MTITMDKLAAGQNAQEWLKSNRQLMSGRTNDFHIHAAQPDDKTLPIAGVGGATQQQADDYWAGKHQELENFAARRFGNGSKAADWLVNHRKNVARGEYNRTAMEREVAEGVEQAKRDLSRNTGFMSGVLHGYGSSQTITGKPGGIGFVRDAWLARNYVNKDWVKRVNAEALSSDPVRRARQLAYRQVAAAKANDMASTLRRQEHGAAHLEGSFINGIAGWAVNPVLKRLPGDWKRNDIAQVFTGLDTNQQATAYGLAATEDFGEEAAAKAEQWLRGAGLVSYVAGAALPALASGGTSSAASTSGAVANTANAATTVGTVANTAKTVAGTASTAKNVGTASRLLRYGMRMGQGYMKGYKKWQPIAEGLHQTGRFADLGGRAADPGRQAIGGILDAAGDMASKMPLWDASNMATDSVMVRLPALNKWVSSGSTAGRLTRFGRTTARWAVADTVNGITDGIMSDMASLASGEKPQEPVADRYTNIIGGMVVVPAVRGLLNKFDSTATMSNAGGGLAEQQKSIDEVMSNPEALTQFKAGLGDPGMPDDVVREQLTTMLSAQRYENSYTNALQTLDKDFDWAGSTPEEYKAKWESYTPEQRGEALYKAFRNDAVNGGYLAPETFTDPNLTGAQRKDLLKTYLQSEDNATGGTLVGQMFRGSKRVGVSAIRNSPPARDAFKAYASSVVKDALDNPDKAVGGLDSTAQAMLDELSPEELRDVMMPITNASPERLMQMQNSLGLPGDNRLAEAGQAAIMQRLRTDGNFAADFIPAFADALKNGNGVSADDSARMLHDVSSTDVKSMFSSMDDDKFTQFARWALSDKGAGALSDMPGGQGSELMSMFTEAAKARAWEGVKRNPLKNLPSMAGLWMQSRGWGAVGNVASNPMVFYGVLALLLTGAVWLGKGLFGKDDDDDYIGSSADAVARSQRQRELLLPGMFG